ncbi:MAG: DUF423 domain-containing protein [Pseudomonadota bacterium]
MTLAAAAALSMAIAVLAVSIGSHALEWRLGSDPERAARTKSFELAERVHVLASLSLLLGHATALPTPSWVIAAWWAAILLFSGALYVHALTGATWLMAATVPGAVGLIVGWIGVAESWVPLEASP